MKLTGHRTRAMFDRYAIAASEDLEAGTAKLGAYLEGSHDTISRTIEGKEEREAG